ncbi:MAG: single-stranded-DNA-specific exonuclease RecJ [Candidatus Dependentiae bacterium]|nr:single-stranded-DNA-specific exonuclease RecJ [Candidatus Dependentiae bacterium]
MNYQCVQGSKYLWLVPPADGKKIADLAAQYSIAFPIAQTLLTRGFTSKEMIDAFLFSSLEKDVALATGMKGALESVERILSAIAKKEKILVFGDYDVDGITSSALMMISLLPLGADINFFLPHRVHDGYGLSTKIVERAARNGYRLIITVDNGITAFEPAIRAKELGVDLIITDHHRPHDAVPEAFAIVNPNQADCTYPFKSLAGVGVTFKILSLLYEQKGLPLPAKAYELLLLGTVADVVPLVGENRFWVRHGLNYINKTESLSLKVLKQNGRVTKPILSSTDIGFSIAPQINALGRLEDPRQGVKFLIGSDWGQVQEVGKVLLDLNEARKEIERSIFMQVTQEVESKRINLETENIIIAASKGWQPGVIGLVASRIVGAYGKPTLLLHLTGKGLAKGSCRSIAGFDMFHALDNARDLLEQFGGHAMAAGLSLKIENIPLLKASLEKQIADQLTPFDLKQKLKIDAELTLPDLTKKLVTDMEHLQPFGNENSEPVFQVKGAVLLQKPTVLKDVHVKCEIFSQGVTKPVIFFNRPELLPLLQAQGENPFDLAVKVSENHWNGRVSVELLGVDGAFNPE